MYELIVMGCFFIVFLNIIYLFSMLADLYGSKVLKVKFPRYKEIKMRPTLDLTCLQIKGVKWNQKGPAPKMLTFYYFKSDLCAVVFFH